MHILDDEFLESLPEDANDAFITYEKFVSEKLKSLPDTAFKETSKNRVYFDLIDAFIEAKNIDLTLQDISNYESSSYSAEDYHQAVNQNKSVIRKFCYARQLKKSSDNDVKLKAIYHIESSQKLKIRHFVEEIKVIIDNASLTPDKRESLMDKLNAFLKEVDKDRSKAEAFLAFFVEVDQSISKTELFKAIVKIIDVLHSSTSIAKIAADKKLSLPAPQKQIEDKSEKIHKIENLDDEIPF